MATYSSSPSDPTHSQTSSTVAAVRSARIADGESAKALRPRAPRRRCVVVQPRQRPSFNSRIENTYFKLTANLLNANLLTANLLTANLLPANLLS